MSRGKPNKRYTPEFKKLVVETMMEEKLSYCETARRFEVSSDTQVRNWEHIYLSEGAEALAIERRGCGSSGRPRVTDVTEFSLFGEKLYLSPILDLNGSDLVSYTISDRPVLSMVTTMLDKEAFAKIPDGTDLILHSDQGWQY